MGGHLLVFPKQVFTKIKNGRPIKGLEINDKVSGQQTLPQS